VVRWMVSENVLAPARHETKWAVGRIGSATYRKRFMRAEMKPVGEYNLTRYWQYHEYHLT
jgi:hypothetical protein